MSEQFILEIEGLRKIYRVGTREVRALDDVSLSVRRGDTVAVVGESGSGKTTLANMILGTESPSAGILRLHGQALPARRDGELKKRIQLVQQNPSSTLNPRKTVGQSVGLPLEVAGTPKAERARRVSELLSRVGLAPEYADRYPSMISGGQRQRAAIARALASDPELLVLDEPTSALDVSVQANILSLLVELRERRSLTYLFITHDLGVVRNISDRVAVFYRGKLVEYGQTSTLFRNPKHHYTCMLLASVPVVSEEEARLRPYWNWSALPKDSGEAGDCVFRPRCPFATWHCKRQPELREYFGGHYAACWNPR